jgi:alcohol dehydrogenase class IV
VRRHTLNGVFPTEADLHGSAFANLAPQGKVRRDTRGMTPDAAAHAAVDAIEQLNSDIHIPARLGDAGLREEMIANGSGRHGGWLPLLNPRPTSREDTEMLYRQAF